MERRFNEAPCGFLSLDYNGVIAEVNTTLLTWLGYQQSELVDQHFELLLSAPNRIIFHSYFYPTIHLHKKIDELFIHLKHKDGSAIPHLVNAQLFFIEEQTFIDCVFLPMTKRISYETELRATKLQLESAYKEKEHALEKLQRLHAEIEQKQRALLQINQELVVLSNTDKLTGIANRRYFEEQLQHFHTLGETFSLCLLDIDYFKKINDTYGHAAGDVVLKNLAMLITTHIRPQDVFARFGGEEFILLLPALAEEAALHVAKTINALVAQTSWPLVDCVTVSLGVATYKPHYTANELIERADCALYSSKKNGRNQATLAN